MDHLLKMATDVYSIDELQKQYNFSPVLLPTKSDCLLYVLSRTKYNGIGHDVAVRKMAKDVQKIWIDADCCPYSDVYIANTLFKKEVWDKYLYLLREKRLPEKTLQQDTRKRSHKKNPSKPNKYGNQPKRKSSRYESSSDTISTAVLEKNDSVIPSDNVYTVDLDSSDIDSSMLNVSTRSQTCSVPSLRKIWEEEGSKLFDIKSEQKVLDCLKKNMTFDKDL